MIMEYAGEFFGTMTLVIFGIGANCQAKLSNSSNVAPSPAGNWTSLSFGWATGIAMGLWISPGGHINPAVTLAFAVWRGFSWKKVPGYIFSQLLGALVGAAIVYGNYIHAIDQFEGGAGIRTMKTAALFGTVPAPWMTAVSCFFAEFLATAMFVTGILALLDEKNAVPPGLIPVGAFILVYGIAACLGFETGFAINPARDLGPRILTSMVGYGGQVYTMRSQYWIWCPVIATILGGQVATFIYDAFLFSETEGLVQKIIGLRSVRRGNKHNSV
jgi:aquaglyceroporin related protein